MARSTLRKYEHRFDGGMNMDQTYRVSIKIGYGHTYSKYNTLMHFLNVVQCYWHNPDLNNIQVFGKDIRTLLVISCQKLFFEEGQTYYHYGPMEMPSFRQRGELDLAVATDLGSALPGVSRAKNKGNSNHLYLTDRVYEYGYLRRILQGVFESAGGVRFKTDNVVLNLSLLSLMLDFGLYEEHFGLLNLPVMQQLRNADKRELQVEVANIIHEFDRKNSTDAVTRLKVEELLFECSYKFLVNKNFPIHSTQNRLIQELNADPAYQQHLLLCKLNMSLCQINKSVEVDYYKLKLNGEFRTVIPQNFSKSTGEYLEAITRQYTFSEVEGVIVYDKLPIFDLRTPQPEIHMYNVRFDSATEIESMVKYVQIRNAFRAVDSEDHYLVFIADNVLHIDVGSVNCGKVSIQINNIEVEVATIFFNEAISFVPCFKYADSEDIILFASPNIRYMVDQGGQFCTDYYGMKHELIECIISIECYVDLNDEHIFKEFKLSELLTESKTVVYFPDYLLQVPSRQQLINLLDLAIHVRNVSFFILVLFYLKRCSISLSFNDREKKIVKITGPWKQAILYVLNRESNSHYDSIFEKQFFDLRQHEDLPLVDFIEVLCENFTKYQRVTDDGAYQIVPTAKQKAFLRRIICSEECFHFSEVGSGKTKVIMPLLCQIFLSNNIDAHEKLQRGGKPKHILVILVPEHLVEDARTQVLRYCLNLNFREEYKVYDDIFALLHDGVELGGASVSGSRFSSTKRAAGSPMKQIFVTSFNQFKRALTNDQICRKVWPYRENILVVTDEVDDFLERDKLVFKIASNKPSTFDRPTLGLFHKVAHAAYTKPSSANRDGADLVISNGGEGDNELSDDALKEARNPIYWRQLFDKFIAIHSEIQHASRSVNKSFGIFTEQTLRHCSTNIAHDIEGYKSLIARPYESVNRAMPGSYYSDVERTIFLTYVILREDIAKYDELFQQERKFISFEYWTDHLSTLDYDDLVYGHSRLSEIVVLHPETQEGLTRFLYEIILRRMEIRDKSRSVNSIDIVFNFDCIGFTGTPFIDNYPTFSYIREKRQDPIPDLIDRSFYVYTSERLPAVEFETRFAQFQGQNSHVIAEYVSSDFVQNECAGDELAILRRIFELEARRATASKLPSFNALVDLCGIFKRSSIYDVRDLVRFYCGTDHFHYIYHIDQADGSDRVLSVATDNDVQFDEEFYKHLCKTYGHALRERVFFFIDNRNVIGKDIPFQLLYKRSFEQPLFTKSAVLAHDVDDFSKIWQAMGRSRTMNDTRFSIYKSGISEAELATPPTPPGIASTKVMSDIKTQVLTRLLYERNCDRKMAGNLSSIYQTLISLFNLSNGSFYYCDTIVNTFLERMQRCIDAKVERHENELRTNILFRSSATHQILHHILAAKFARSSVAVVAQEPLTTALIETLLRHIVKQKYEVRVPSGDLYDEFIRALSGEQQSLMEISYTKQQQKQKQKQQNKNKDADTMALFDKKNQIDITIETNNYFNYARTPLKDRPRIYLGLPLSVPIMELNYTFGDDDRRAVRVYPTLQFLYSHHIHGEYITDEVKSLLKAYSGTESFCASFLAATEAEAESVEAMEEEVEEEEESDTIKEGKVVVIHGCTQRRFNGCRGRVLFYDEARGRWGVKLTLRDVEEGDGSPRSRTKKAFFKEKNLRVVTEEENDPLAQQHLLLLPTAPFHRRDRRAFRNRSDTNLSASRARVLNDLSLASEVRRFCVGRGKPQNLGQAASFAIDAVPSFTTRARSPTGRSLRCGGGGILSLATPPV